jgi:hypothetical protein
VGEARGAGRRLELEAECAKFDPPLGAKYKVGRSGVPDPGDAYQALAYCRALDVRCSVLLYPDRANSRHFVFRDRANEILTDGIVLAQPVEAVERSMTALTHRLVALASARPARETGVLRGV